MSRQSRCEEKAARRRAKRILEIRPGSVTVYTAYLVVSIRLLGTARPSLRGRCATSSITACASAR